MVNRNIDYSTRDYEGFRQDLIDLLKQKIPEYTDFSQSDAGIVLIELLAHGLDILSYYNDVVANEVFLPTAKDRESVIKLCRLIGYELSNATPAKFYQVFEIEPQETSFRIPKGFVVKTRATDTEDSVVFELDEDLVIPAGKTGLEQNEEGEYLYKGIVTQGYTIRDEVLGTSNGTPYQKFQLSYYPVIEDSVVIKVNDGAIISTWEKVDNFIDSKADSKVYKILVDDMGRLTVEFGSGRSGRIPNEIINGILATYRVGGGEIGNVGIGMITEFDQKIAGLKATFNPYEPLEYGHEQESIETARIKAPAQLRTLWRAVTRQDYEDLAIQYPHVLKASAVEGEDKHSIYLYILPDRGETMPQEMKQGLQEYFRERKQIGYDIFIENPRFKYVDIVINVQVFQSELNTEVKSAVEGLVESLLELGNMGFGEELIKSNLIGEIRSIQGVRAVDIELSDAVPDVDEIIRLRNLTVNAWGGVEGETARY